MQIRNKLALVGAFILVSTSILSALVYSAPDQSKNTILIIDSQKGSPYQDVRIALINELAKLGYSEQTGTSFEYHSLSHFKGAAKNLWKFRIQKNHYSAIVLNGTLATEAFKEIAWKKSPYQFIYATVTDPIGLGVITTYHQPPIANFTGITSQVPFESRLEFITEILPHTKNIGFIYADMPQSHSYRTSIQSVINKDKWKHIQFHFRKVPFIPSEGGHKRMTQIAEQFVKELDPLVDVFLSPSDQMGAQPPFPAMVKEKATKPLVGVILDDVQSQWGATATIYTDLEGVGHQAAYMVAQVLKGEVVKNIYPLHPKKYGIIISKKLAAKHNLSLSNKLRKQALIVE